MKKIISIFLLFTVQAIALKSIACTGKKPSDIEKIAFKVLYVGYNPEKPMPGNMVYYSTSPQVVQNAYKTRMADLKGWHTYALLPKDSPFIPTEVLLELPEGASIDYNEIWGSSTSVPFPGYEGFFVLEGKATFSVNGDLKKAKPGAIIKCGLSYQTCDENKCFPPNRKMIDVKSNIITNW